jgi:hypothetical protein
LRKGHKCSTRSERSASRQNIGISCISLLNGLARRQKWQTLPFLDYTNIGNYQKKALYTSAKQTNKGVEGMLYNKEYLELQAEAILAELERLERFIKKTKKVFSAKNAHNIQNINNGKILTEEICNNISTTSIDNIPTNSNDSNFDKTDIIDKTNKKSKVNKTNENAEYIPVVQKLYAEYFANLPALEYKKLTSPSSMNESADVYRKLLKHGYTADAIRQAVHSARRDAFWSQQFRSMRKLIRKNRDGVSYIDVFLAMNQQNHKMAIPKIIR